MNFEASMGNASISRVISVNAGKTYYVEAEMLFFAGGIDVRILDEESGAAEVRNLKQASR